MAVSEIGKNTTVTICPQGSTTSYVDGACIKEIGEFSSTANAIDVTCYGPQNITRKIKSIVDLGTFDITIAYNGKTTGAGLWEALQKPESCDVEIVMSYGVTPTVETLKFSALITGVSLSVPKDDVMTQRISLTLDGRVKPTFT